MSCNAYTCPHCGGTATEHKGDCPQGIWIRSLPVAKSFDPDFEFELRMKDSTISRLQKQLSEHMKEVDVRPEPPTYKGRF